MVVDFKVTFDEDISDDQARTVLKKAIKVGKLGSFSVSTESVKPVSPTKSPRSK